LAEYVQLYGSVRVDLQPIPLQDRTACRQAEPRGTGTVGYLPAGYLPARTTRIGAIPAVQTGMEATPLADGVDSGELEKEMNASAWTREEHYHFLKALQQYGDARKTMPASEWLQKIADAVGTRSLEETREHIQEYFQATNHEGLMPASLMSMHEQQYNNQPVQIIHPNAIMECAMPLPIQQPPRLSPACFARIKAQQQTLLGSYCTASEWTREEQIVLEEGLKRFPASQYNNLTRYVKIAAFLPDKTIADVAKRYKWMVELQRLNSINFADDSDGRHNELPASPSESSTLHQPGGGAHFAPNGDKIEVAGAVGGLHARSTGASSAKGSQSSPHSGQETVTSEGGVSRLLDENDALIRAVKGELTGGDAEGNAPSRGGPAATASSLASDGGAMEKMIRFRSNLSNILNCLAMSSGCMSKMPPLLVKLHPLPFIETSGTRTGGTRVGEAPKREPAGRADATGFAAAAAGEQSAPPPGDAGVAAAASTEPKIVAAEGTAVHGSSRTGGTTASSVSGARVKVKVEAVKVDTESAQPQVPKPPSSAADASINRKQEAETKVDADASENQEPPEEKTASQLKTSRPTRATAKASPDRRSSTRNTKRKRR
jgi:hypothetical protein